MNTIERGWSAPFSDWVVKSWEDHSKQINGPEIVERVRQTLSDPQATKERAFKGKKLTTKGN